MSLEAELQDFYQQHGFGDSFGSRPRLVPVYTGCILVPLPNIETRRRFLKYHDLHHLVTGYSVGRIGEGEVSAWELGTGSAFVSPTLGVMNLIALSTGLFLEPQRMWAAFRHGCRSRNLYSAQIRAEIEANRWTEISALRADVLEVRDNARPAPLRAIEFAVYATLAVGIHACLAIPAVIARFVSDIVFGGSVFEAVKPKKRADLY
jgi:hypothetical protein